MYEWKNIHNRRDKRKVGKILKEQPVYQVILFGSYAKKQATPASDIDLIIDTRSELKGFAFVEANLSNTRRTKKGYRWI